MSASGFPEVLAIADDATGALEVGGQFAAEGVRALVTLRSELSAYSGALVVDTESRYMEPEQAALAVASLAAAARAAGVEHIFKKTDSTLRGNIAAELEALLDVFPERVLVYVPAYPKMNRVVCGGEVFVDGRPLTEASAVADPTKPAKSGSIPDLMRSRCRAEVLLVAGAEELASRLASAPAGSVVVCDGRSDADLAGAAGVLARTQRAYLVAGTGGFVGDWVRRLPVPSP
jgi:uncharacterized protein YgbK (DUF1537 family)